MLADPAFFGAETPPEYGESAEWEPEVAATAADSIAGMYDRYMEVVRSLPAKRALQARIAADPTLTPEQRADAVTWGRSLAAVQVAVDAGDYAIQTVMRWYRSVFG